MRREFADEAVKLAAQDPRIVMLSGDIGNNLFEPFKKTAPNRFYNCGVAEANMAGLAAGLAMCGLRPITYTITPFNTTRCLEQIRDDIAYHNLPVLIVGTGAGLSYASLGCTHHSCEDISFLRSIPNMTVLAPGDAWEVRALLREILKQDGPCYMRIGKTGEPLVHTDIPPIKIGKAFRMREGKEIAILSTGNMLPTALSIEIDAAVYSFHTIKPLDTDLLRTLSDEYSLVVTIEEHSLIGGLGSAVAEWLADHPSKARLLRFGTPDLFPHPIGSQMYFREKFGLEPKNLTQAITHAYESCYSR